MPKTRPARPRFVRPHAMSGPCVGLHAAAAHHKIDTESLFEAAESGWMPPWVAQKSVELPILTNTPDIDRWMFATSSLSTHGAKHLACEWLWLRRIPLSDCDLTAAWAADPIAGGADLRQIAEWCRASSPDALSADPGDFALWCADHPYGGECTSRRHSSVRRWMQMLREQGAEPVALTDPAMRTRLLIVSND